MTYKNQTTPFHQLPVLFVPEANSPVYGGYSSPIKSLFLEKFCILINSRSRDNLICPFKSGGQQRPERHLCYSHPHPPQSHRRKRKASPSANWCREKSKEDKPRFSICLEATGISIPGANKWVLYTPVKEPFEALASWLAAFLICPSQSLGNGKHTQGKDLER